MGCWTITKRKTAEKEMTVTSARTRLFRFEISFHLSNVATSLTSMSFLQCGAFWKYFLQSKYLYNTPKLGKLSPFPHVFSALPYILEVLMLVDQTKIRTSKTLRNEKNAFVSVIEHLFRM